MVLSPGTQLGQFEIVGHLGSGGMGQVYRARDTKLGREVAIKVSPVFFNNNPNRMAGFKLQFATPARREANMRGKCHV